MVAQLSSAASGKNSRGLSKAKKRESKLERRAKRAAKATISVQYIESEIRVARFYMVNL